MAIPPWAALGAIIVGAGAVILLWIQDTPYVNGLADWLTNAGRITGLLAGYAVVVLLALMARVLRSNAGSALTGWPAGTRWAAATR